MGSYFAVNCAFVLCFLLISKTKDTVVYGFLLYDIVALCETTILVGLKINLCRHVIYDAFENSLSKHRGFNYNEIDP